MSLENVNLTGHFLIAMPNLQDSVFAKSVTFICAHNQDGAMGIIINRPTNLVFKTLYEKVNIPLNNLAISNQAVLYGGPVQPERGFVLHTIEQKNNQPMNKEEWDSSLNIIQEIAFTTSKDILEALGEGLGPKKLLLSLGYAGWTAGQLEQEILQNAWLSAQTEDPVILKNILFDMPYEERLNATLALLGIHSYMLSDVAGHA